MVPPIYLYIYSHPMEYFKGVNKKANVDGWSWVFYTDDWTCLLHMINLNQWVLKLAVLSRKTDWSTQLHLLHTIQNSLLPLNVVLAILEFCSAHLHTKIQALKFLFFFVGILPFLYVHVNDYIGDMITLSVWEGISYFFSLR